VASGGLADAVGIKPDDVIMAFAGEVVEDLHHFHAMLAGQKPGDTDEVTVWRDGETLTVSPVLGEDK